MRLVGVPELPGAAEQVLQEQHDMRLRDPGPRLPLSAPSPHRGTPSEVAVSSQGLRPQRTPTEPSRAAGALVFRYEVTSADATRL